MNISGGNFDDNSIIDNLSIFKDMRDHHQSSTGNFGVFQNKQ